MGGVRTYLGPAGRVVHAQHFVEAHDVYTILNERLISALTRVQPRCTTQRCGLTDRSPRLGSGTRSG